ncbi:MAG: hypothetical protein JKY15_00850 [Deltaproteobacteria bacterium]|nr:hypothetical protein [Deltaproteobacteria bacterium]
MRHLNFIETGERLRLRRGVFKLDYLLMILISAFCLGIALAINSQQKHQLQNWQRIETSLKSHIASKQGQMFGRVKEPWVEWAPILRRYSREFPSYLRLNRLTASTQDVPKLLFEAISATPSQAAVASHALEKMGICNGVELRQLEHSNDLVSFELECQIL